MIYRVTVSQEAEDDLLDIYDYITRSSSAKAARSELSQLKRSCKTLARTPLRGHYPAELQRVGITIYRESHHGHIRIIYEVIPEEVCIHAILDGRRSLEELLERRLLR